MRVFPGNQAKSFPGMGQVIYYEEGGGAAKWEGVARFTSPKRRWAVRKVLAMLKGGRGEGVAKGFKVVLPQGIYKR